MQYSLSPSEVMAATGSKIGLVGWQLRDSDFPPALLEIKHPDFFSGEVFSAPKRRARAGVSGFRRLRSGCEVDTVL